MWQTISIVFADGTNMFMGSKNIQSVVMNQELTLVSKWLKVNKFSPNLKKHCMISSNKSGVCCQIDLRIDGEHIQEVGKNKISGCSYWQKPFLEKSYIVHNW